jgi:hypothetical protein
MNHSIANGLELQRAEFAGHGVAVKLAKQPERLAEVV